MEGVSIYDYQNAIRPINTANLAVAFFFNFTTFFAMTICFFSLISSMYTNITEQKKEIGILLSMGLPKPWLKRAYVEEAFILVCASCILGIIIGTFLAWTITLQRQVLIGMPLSFPFPYLLLFTIVMLSFAFAIASALYPITVTIRNPIVQIMRAYM